MKKILTAVFCAMLLLGTAVEAGSSSRGGFSSSGSSRSYSSGSSNRGSFSSSPRQFAPSVSPNRGGFNSSTTTRSSVSPSTRTTTTTTTINRSYSYGGRYVSPGGYYGHWGMGYGYSNGLLTGMIIGGMMHPYNTVWYTGPGYYSNNALLYPDGRVVDQRGYVVGNYVDGQFTAVQNGAYVAQPVPSDANQQQVQSQVQPQQSQPQQVIVVNRGPTVVDVFLYVILGIGCFILLITLLGMLL